MSQCDLATSLDTSIEELDLEKNLLKEEEGEDMLLKIYLDSKEEFISEWPSY